MVRSLGSDLGPRLLWCLAQCLPQDTGRSVRAPSPTRAGRAAQHQDGPGRWKSCYRTYLGGAGGQYTLMERTPLSLSGGCPPHLLGSPCLLPEEGCLSIAETDEKEINYLFKSYTDLE